MNYHEPTTTIRERVHHVLTKDPQPFSVVHRRLAGHPDTWILCNKSRVRKIVQAMAQRGEIRGTFNRRLNRHEYSKQPWSRVTGGSIKGVVTSG